MAACLESSSSPLYSPMVSIASVLQCVAVCCSVLQCVLCRFTAPCPRVLEMVPLRCIHLRLRSLVCCSVLQRVAAYCIVLQYVLGRFTAPWPRVLKFSLSVVFTCGLARWCVAVCCSVLQCVAVCYMSFHSFTTAYFFERSSFPLSFPIFFFYRWMHNLRMSHFKYERVISHE